MHNKKRILFITPLPPSTGGVAAAMDAILSSSIWDKYDVEILNISRKDRFGEQAGFTPYNIVTTINHLLKLLKKCSLKKPEIIHLPVTSYFALLKSAGFILIAKIFHAKTVMHLHGGAFEEWYYRSSKLVKCFIKFILNSADRVIALSFKWTLFLSGIGLSNRKIRVLNNPVRREFMDFTLKQKTSANRKDRKISIVFIGPMREQKGLYDILAAILLLKKSKLTMNFKFIGREEKDEKGQWIRKRYIQSGSMEYCNFTGFLTGLNLIREIANSDIFILPSYYENYPVSILEAMVLGLPIISTNVGGVPEIVEDGVNGFLIEPGDVESLGEKILYFAKNPEIRKKMGERNKAKARKLFSPDIAAKKLEGIFNELL